MKTLLCSIGRLENRYIREWVEYNKGIGFTNIVLYDNNYDGEEHFEDVIGDYIEEGFVILKNYRNQKVCQLKAYNECYKEYGKEYDWVAFFDCDEFLTFTKKKNIEEYLSSILFKKYDAIHINWMCYGDNDIIKYEDKPLLERFTTPIPYDKCVAYRFPENDHIKTIIRGGLNKSFIWKATPHTPNGQLYCCNGRGISCKIESPFEPYTFDEAYLRHFSTKTIEEYCDKLKRGFPDHLFDLKAKGKNMLETRFFKYNKVTEEKLKYVKESLDIDIDLPVYVEGGKRKDVQVFMLCYDEKNYGFLDDSVVTPLQCGAQNRPEVCKVKDNTGDNISSQNMFFVENTGIYWIWKNIKDAKYKGNMQYRRRLEGINEKTDFEDIFAKYDIICAKPYNYPENHNAFIPSDTVLGGYEYSHCKEDLLKLGEILIETHPEYKDDWEKVIVKGENLYYSNGFVLPAQKYDEYCEFLFGLLSKWIVKNKFKTFADVVEHVKKNLNDGKYIRYEREGLDPKNLPQNALRWQCMIPGFLSERILTLWINHNIPKNKRYEVNYTKMENTYI